MPDLAEPAEPRLLLTELADDFTARTGQAVALESVGGVDAAKRVQAGEVFDAVFLASDAIDKLLARAGTDKSRILMAQIFLADLVDFPAMNAVWDAWVVPGHTPPRATVQAQLANPDWKIEVVVTAAL